MPNVNPQAIRVANEKMRRVGNKAAQLYSLLKVYAAESSAEGWLTLFPNDAEVIVDGSAVDGRTPITNTDVRALITFASAYITFMEQASNANRDLVMKIAVSPEEL
jgi:hypothetical protein